MGDKDDSVMADGSSEGAAGAAVSGRNNAHIPPADDSLPHDVNNEDETKEHVDETSAFIPSNAHPTVPSSNITVNPCSSNSVEENHPASPSSPTIRAPELPIPPQQEPPDGGLQAWLVMLASFFTNGILFGTINSTGVIFNVLKNELEAKGVENPASRASLCFSLAIGMTFLMSVLSGVLTDKLGIRKTTFIGGALATLGMFLSSLVYDRIELLTFTFGFMVGVGGSLAYTPSLVILGHYFRKRMGIVNGFVTAGSSLFTVVLAMLFEFLLEKHGLKVLFQVLSALMSLLMVFAFIFKPRLPKPEHSNDSEVPSSARGFKQRIKRALGAVFNLDIWQNKRYVIWALCIPLALFGYFVPYIHLVAFTKAMLGEDAQGKVLVQCIGATSLLGRLIFGFIADKPWVDRILLQQISFFCIGTFTMLLTSYNNFWFYLVLALGMGLFDGCFISLLGPIAFDIVGPAGAPQAIGNLLALCSVPLTFGPVFAGMLEDSLGSYFVPFLVAGMPPILGGFALFSMKCVRPPRLGEPGSPAKEPIEPQNNAAPVPPLLPTAPPAYDDPPPPYHNQPSTISLENGYGMMGSRTEEPALELSILDSSV